MFSDYCKEVLAKCEWVSIATHGVQGPHMVATWGDYIRKLGIGTRLLVPAGGFEQTEQNLQQDPRIAVLCSTRAVAGAYGPGGGCLLRGQGEMQVAGPYFEAVKREFPWARAALVIHVQEAVELLK